MTEDGKVMRELLLQVVDNQIRDLEPPETRGTLDRLVAEGFEPEEARLLIANVVATEIVEVIQREQPYDHDRFVAALDRLPELPE